jgi:hypothetical protein
MSKPKIYTIPRQFLTLRLTNAEWSLLAKIAKNMKISKTVLGSGVISNWLINRREDGVKLAGHPFTKTK